MCFLFFSQVAWGYSGAGILNSGVLPVIQLFNTHLFTVLFLINPCLFFIFAFKSIQIFWLDAEMGLKMCYLSLVNREEIWAWNSHVTANHKVNMSIIHCSYDLIYQHLNYSFSWFLSLSLYLTIYIWLSQYFHIHFNRIAAEWFMGGWLGHALHVKGYPCWWKKQTRTQSGVFELLSPAAPEEELESHWTVWTRRI